MNRLMNNSSRIGVAAICLATSAASLQAVTTNITRTVETNATNRPFFTQAAFPTFANDIGWVGTATPGVSNSSALSNADAGVGGNNTVLVPDGNGVPLGVGISFGASFS